MNTFFSDKIILWRKMTKIWLKIWLKVKENGTKKVKLAKMVAKEKKILVRTLRPLIIEIFQVWRKVVIKAEWSYFQGGCKVEFSAVIFFSEKK